MADSVTVASVCARGVQRRRVYCLGKREGDCPCHHSGTHCRLINFRLTKSLRISSAAAVALSADGGGLIRDPTTASSWRRGGGGWMTAPTRFGRDANASLA